MYDRKQGRDRAYKKKEILQEIKKMKKTIVAILIIAIAAFSCFAVDSASDNSVTLNGAVKEAFTPSIELVASLTQSKTVAYASGTSLNVATIDGEGVVTGTGVDEAGTVYFQILDRSIVNAVQDHSNEIEVTVGAWKQDGTGATEGVSMKSISQGAFSLEGVTASGVADVANVTASSTVANKVLLTYAKNVYVNFNAAIVAAFSASWSADSGNQHMNAGNYTAEVAIEITSI